MKENNLIKILNRIWKVFILLTLISTCTGILTNTLLNNQVPFIISIISLVICGVIDTWLVIIEGK